MLSSLGIKHFATGLIRDDFTADDAIALVSDALNDEFNTFNGQTFEDIPKPFRRWVQEQDGLKISGQPIQSLDQLSTTYQLLSRKPAGLAVTQMKMNSTKLIFDIAKRYFKQVLRFNWTLSKIAAVTVQGQTPLARKCGSYGQPLLDDPYPRFKKAEPTRYVARYLKHGCGRESCCPRATTVYALPLDPSRTWSPQDKNLLSRRPQVADWKRHFIRQPHIAEKLAREVTCVCRPCTKRGLECMKRVDKNPEWTVESHPRYVTKGYRCQVCGASTKWIPFDEAVGYIDRALLTKSWKTFVNQNGSLKDLRDHPDWFFPKRAADRKRQCRKDTQ